MDGLEQSFKKYIAISFKKMMQGVLEDSKQKPCFDLEIWVKPQALGMFWTKMVELGRFLKMQEFGFW